MPVEAPESHRARRLSTAEPTLPELIASAWRGVGWPRRAAGLLAAALLVAAVVFLAVRGESFSYSGPAAPPFEISWSELERVAPEGDEILRLERREDGDPVEALSVRPLPSDVSAGAQATGGLAELALAAEAVRERVRSEHPGARVPLEGRTMLAVDRGPEAYQLGFRAPAGAAGTLIGKLYLVPDPERPGEGVEIEVIERVSRGAVLRKLERSPAGFFLHWPIQPLLEDAAAVSTSRAFEGPLRSFSFG